MEKTPKHYNARSEHCAFARLNSNGKCIAHCIHTNNLSACDCTGTTGKTVDVDFGREVIITPGCKITVLPQRDPSEIRDDTARPTAPNGKAVWGDGTLPSIYKHTTSKGRV